MRYLALACDYDGTLATDGRVSEETLRALQRVRDSGRKLLLVTGRELEDLMEVFDRLELFDRVVAENGALLYRPGSKEEHPLADPPEEKFVRVLRDREVSPLSTGRVIVATWHPNETTVMEVIRDLGLELQVIFNKGAVMILPSGVNKRTGLEAALHELGISPHNAVGIGDAENDHAFLALCECSVAVANALPSLKERADLVTDGDHGAGVEELVRRLVENDLSDLEGRLSRHDLLLGARDDDGEVRVRPFGENVLVAGPSGVGKSTTTTGFLERLAEAGYQFCLIDPEGDYEGLEEAVTLGDRDTAPSVAEVLQVLDEPDQNVVANLLGHRLDDRPPFFESLLPRLQEMRARMGRPHWIVIDEAHHMMPSPWDPTSLTLPKRLQGLLLITVHPDHLSKAILSSVDTVVALGDSAADSVAFVRGLHSDGAHEASGPDVRSGEALVWSRLRDEDPVRVRISPPRTEHRRHRRKYAEGELGEDSSFYFTGPDGRLNLRAQNLVLFMQMADGVDDETWLHHLRRGDYSRWLRHSIKDEGLADEVARVEAEERPAAESRDRVRAAIESRYTAPP